MEKIVVNRTAQPTISFFLPGEGPELEFEPDPEGERYQILGVASFDDADLPTPLREQLERAGFADQLNSPATIWFFPTTGDAFVQGRSFGDLPAETTFLLPPEYLDFVHDICRPDVKPNEYWTFKAIRVGCFFYGHVYRYGFDTEGDSYKICLNCGRQLYTSVLDEDDWDTDGPEDWEELVRFPAPESLSERLSYFAAIVPLLSGTWQTEGSLILHPGWNDGVHTIILVGEPFDSEPSRISVEISAEELFSLLRDRYRAEGTIRVLAVNVPTGEGYFELNDSEEWVLKIEWSVNAQRLLTLTFPATFEFSNSPGRVTFQARVDRKQFFNALDALSAAIQTAKDSDEPEVV